MEAETRFLLPDQHTYDEGRTNGVGKVSRSFKYTSLGEALEASARNCRKRNQAALPGWIPGIGADPPARDITAWSIADVYAPCAGHIFCAPPRVDRE
jgi:hypothetical protein